MTATNSLTVDQNMVILNDENDTPFLTLCQDGKTIGELRVKDGVMSFSGDAEQSAKMFFDHLIKIHNDFACPKCEQKVNV